MCVCMCVCVRSYLQNSPVTSESWVNTHGQFLSRVNRM